MSDTIPPTVPTVSDSMALTVPVYIKFDDFTKVDIRVGKVLSAEPVPKSKKLLKLEIDFGTIGKRVILAGVAKNYTVEQIVGLKVAAVVNLEPREMMGTVSHGMLLAGHGEGDSIHLVTCPDVSVGGGLG
jgi:methionyl-tRNA synthetase